MEYGDWDVEKYRSPTEPRHHWELKKKFMEENKHRMPEERLVCLAQTLGNIEFLGCQYPEDTMAEIAELSRGIIEEFHEASSNRLKRTFVSGSQAASSRVNRTNGDGKRSAATAELPQPAAKICKYGNFVAASTTSTLQEEEEVGTSFSQGFILPPLREQTATTHRTIQSISVTIGSGARRDVHLEQGEPAEEEEPQRQFRQPQYAVGVQHLRLQLNYDFPLHKFMVVTLGYFPEESPLQILQRSAGFCKCSVSWEYSGNQSCYVMVDNYRVCEERGATRQEARDKATSRAVDILKENCYTICVKSRFMSDGTEIDLIDVEDNTVVGGKKEALGHTNVGHKLLQLMGWSGGGLGRDGGGISEPITARTIFGREGLGASGVGKNFKQKITKIVQEYVSSNSPYDLVFTTGFDNEQRKEMHQIARRFGLKSRSFGKGEDRHLTISRKFDSASLVEELLRRGGESEKYILLPPGMFS